jgi:hypothetical protein
MDENRKKLMVIGLGLSVVILGGWYGISNVLLVKPVPDMRVASAAEMVDYLGDKRGLSHLSVDKRREVILAMGSAYGGGRQGELISELDRMAPSEKERFVDAVFEVGKEDFLTDAENYLALDEEEKKKFIKEKLDHYEKTRKDLRSSASGGGGGNGGGDGASFADVFSSVPGMPTRTQDVTKAIVAKTSPSERAKAKPFLDNLGAEVERRKKRSSR